MLQGCTKYLVFIALRKTIAEAYAYLEGVHVRLQDTATNRFQILTEWSATFKIVSRFVMSLFIFLASALLLFPTVLYVTVGRVEYMLPIMVPKIDETNRIGYILLQCVHALWLSCGACGFIGSDTTLIMMSLYSWPLSYLFIDHINELNQLLRTTPEYADTREMRQFLQNIVRLHQELCQ